MLTYGLNTWTVGWEDGLLKYPKNLPRSLWMTSNDPWFQLVDRLSKEWLLHFMKWIAWLAIDDDDDWWWDPWWWWCCWSSWRSLYPGSRGSDIDLIDYSIKNHSSHVLMRSVQGTFLAWFSAYTICVGEILR